MSRNYASSGRRIFLTAILGISASVVSGQFQPSPATGSAASIPADRLLQPEQLHAMLQHPMHRAPLILQVGSRMLYSEAHIPGSEYAGPGSQPAGQEMLRNRVAPLPRNSLVVIYCGCCPWERCPNLGPAFEQLRNLGFTNVKALYMANNFGADWVAKGYEVEKR